VETTSHLYQGVCTTSITSAYIACSGRPTTAIGSGRIAAA
jgi:hypothetical protein